MRILLSLYVQTRNEKIRIFNNLLKIFFEASQRKVVSVCVLIIFDITVRYMKVDLLVRTSIGNKNGVRCPLFGVRCPLLRGFYNRDLNYN